MSDHRKRKGTSKLSADLFSQQVKTGDLLAENHELAEEVRRLLLRVACLQNRIEELEARPVDVRRWLEPVTEAPSRRVG